MKIPLARIQIIGMVFAILFSHWACGLGAQPTNIAPSDNAPSATQAPAAAKGERGTPDEARAMLQLAVEHYNAVGRDQALAAFNAGQSPFKDRDLYVVCIGPDHIETANGGFPQYAGTSADSLIDDNGVPVGTASWHAASAGGQGSVKYKWVNPVSGATEPKILFVQKLGTEDICGVGAYNP